MVVIIFYFFWSSHTVYLFFLQYIHTKLCSIYGINTNSQMTSSQFAPNFRFVRAMLQHCRVVFVSCLSLIFFRFLNFIFLSWSLKKLRKPTFHTLSAVRRWWSVSDGFKFLPRAVVWGSKLFLQLSGVYFATAAPRCDCSSIQMTLAERLQ